MNNSRSSSFWLHKHLRFRVHHNQYFHNTIYHNLCFRDILAALIRAVPMSAGFCLRVSLKYADPKILLEGRILEESIERYLRNFDSPKSYRVLLCVLCFQFSFCKVSDTHMPGTLEGNGTDFPTLRQQIRLFPADKVEQAADSCQPGIACLR